MLTNPRTGAFISPTGLIEPGKIYTSATLPAAALAGKGTTAYTSDAGPMQSNGSSWQFISGAEATVPDITLGNASAAAANSTRIQAAVDAVAAAGNGTVRLPATGTSSYIAIDTPLLLPAGVSLIGNDEYGTILKKTTATPSTLSDATERSWDSTTVGFPVCVAHLRPGWSGTVSHLQFVGDTASPNTTTTEYGLFSGGMSNGHVHKCVFQFVRCGGFWGTNSTIGSSIEQCVAAEVWRSFYVHSGTGLTYARNYANDFRHAGHILRSLHYSSALNNAADNAATWKVGATEIARAYEIHAWEGGSFRDNGCETHNGSVWLFSNCIRTLFANNTAKDVSSNYTGGSDVVLLETASNNSCIYLDNFAQTSGMTGTGARHFTKKITSELGTYVWQRNRFVASVGDSTDTSTWVNTSGTIDESQTIQGTAAKLYGGSGTPEGSVTAAVGSLYVRTNGGAGTTLYVKESGAGNTGWIAK